MPLDILDRLENANDRRSLDRWMADACLEIDDLRYKLTTLQLSQAHAIEALRLVLRNSFLTKAQRLSARVALDKLQAAQEQPVP